MKMNKTITAFAIIALAAVFALAFPLDTAVAQSDDSAHDGSGGQYKDGNHDGKSCPNKDKKSNTAEQSS